MAMQTTHSSPKDVTYKVLINKPMDEPEVNKLPFLMTSPYNILIKRFYFNVMHSCLRPCTLHEFPGSAEDQDMCWGQWSVINPNLIEIKNLIC